MLSGLSVRDIVLIDRIDLEFATGLNVLTGETGAGKTEIMYSANMSYHQIQKYLDFLVNQGFVNKVNMDNTLVAYQVTDSGLKLLKAIDTLMEMLEN